MTYALAFIGGGQMATALAIGAIGCGLLEEAQVVLAEPYEAQRARLKARLPAARLVATATEALALTSRIVLSVKPQVLPAVCAEVRSVARAEHLFISIAAGFTLPQLETLLGSQRIIRVMPNTPAQVGHGAAGISVAAGATEADIEFAERLMGSVGRAVRVPDNLMHAVTGLSGSGPAYVYLMIEALSDGAVAQGLPRELAVTLAAQTVLGAARMVLDTGLHPGVLRDQVTSPGGTTIAGLCALEQAAVRGGFIAAIAAATARSQELAQ